MMKSVVPMFCLAAAAASAQVLPTSPGSDRVEVTVARTMTLKVEEAALSIGIAAPSTASFEAVVKAAEPIGVKESDLQYVSPYYGPPGPLPQQANRVAYTFQLRVPAAQLSETLQKVEQLRRSLLASDAGFELAGQGVTGFGASERSREAARAQLLEGALADARSRAESLARAAAVPLGPIVGVTEVSGYPTGPGVPPTTVAYLNLTVRFAATR